MSQSDLARLGLASQRDRLDRPVRPAGSDSVQLMKKLNAVETQKTTRDLSDGLVCEEQRLQAEGARSVLGSTRPG